MASSHRRGVHSRHKLHLRNYSPQFHNTESVALIAFCVIGLAVIGCLCFTGRDNERLVLTICTKQANQNQSPPSSAAGRMLRTSDDKLLANNGR